MPLPEKEYFALEEIEERWNIRRLDTVYYAENGLLEIATRVVGVVIETGIIETESDGRWFRLPEERRRCSGLLTLRACDLAILLRRGSMTIQCFQAGAAGYGDIVAPEDGLEVHACDLVVTRSERDRFERLHALGEPVKVNGSQALPVMLTIECSGDGGWIKVHGREYLFPACSRNGGSPALRRATGSGSPKLPCRLCWKRSSLRSRHISQCSAAGNRSWRDIIGYGRGSFG